MKNRLIFALLSGALLMTAAHGASAKESTNALASAEPMALANAACAASDAAFLSQQEQSQAAQESAQDAQQAQEEADRAREAQDDARERARDAEERVRDAQERARDKYEAGLDAIDDSKWDKARQTFDEIVQNGTSNADAALYWRAYCEDKLGRRSDALTSITDLEHKYPRSRWQNDARALEVQVRHETGEPVSPQSQSDEELKLLAINGLMQSDPSQALPLLEKVLNGTGSPRVKERALFVLAQSGAPEASQILLHIAEGNSNPELQTKAVKYLGLFGGSKGVEALSQVYASSSDEEVKRSILQSFMLAGARDRLYAAAQNEKNQDLQREAVQMLGVSGDREDLWKLYQATPPEEVRRAILQAMFISGDADHLEQLAKNEKNEDLRIAAIRDMGLIGSDRTGSTLISMYAGAKDPGTSRAVLQALFLQGNAQAIVDIARKETDPEMKKQAVEKLSLMHSKVATDYLLEILNK
ncbi:MAG TPA: HEAT repeat domain-containing protein [Candidatus Acidoferrales bacterium]|nr:HEAT repeat domain-containing protein [Candidatus Acidoferrales bacterium]